MSEVLKRAPTFFSLYDQGLVTAEQIDDFVGDWHDSGDDEERSLAEYLGMTDLEYSAFFVTRRALPFILAARRDNRPLPELLISLYASLCQNPRTSESSVPFALGHWLKANPPA